MAKWPNLDSFPTFLSPNALFKLSPLTPNSIKMRLEQHLLSGKLFRMQFQHGVSLVVNSCLQVILGSLHQQLPIFETSRTEVDELMTRLNSLDRYSTGSNPVIQMISLYSWAPASHITTFGFIILVLPHMYKTLNVQKWPYKS